MRSASKIILITLAVWVLLGGIAFADIPPPADAGGTDFQIPNPLSCGSGQENPLQDCVQKVLTDLLILATPIVAVMVIIGGYQILTAGGEPEKFSRGKKTIIYAAVGFAIILMANGVVYIIQDVFNGSGGGGGCGAYPQFPTNAAGDPWTCVGGQWQ